MKKHGPAIKQTLFCLIFIALVGAGLYLVLQPALKGSVQADYYSEAEHYSYWFPTDYLSKNGGSFSEDNAVPIKKDGSQPIFKIESLPSYLVDYIIDGNTVILENGERIRLVGIKAPDKYDDYGIEATDFLKKLIEGKTVYFQEDKLNPQDDFGRMRGLIYFDKKNINIEMIRSGYAHIYPVLPSMISYDEWKIFETEAREAKRGLWSGEKSTGLEEMTKDTL